MVFIYLDYFSGTLEKHNAIPSIWKVFQAMLLLSVVSLRMKRLQHRITKNIL